jgi:hydroxyethylthiazole kinase
MDVIEPGNAFAVLQAVRDMRPRVHCLTNHVAKTFTANVLLAVGAVPSMSADESEVGAFVAGANALLVNLGTLDSPMRASINVAMNVAAANGLPTMIDPVFADRSDARAAYARNLISSSPAGIRCNQSEADAIGKAVLVEAGETGTIISINGSVDQIFGGGRQTNIHGGHALMARVTAMGCALGAVQAACLAAGGERLDAVGAACLLFKRAGQVAGKKSAGPGSFVPAFLDALYNADEALFRSDAADHGGE